MVVTTRAMVGLVALALLTAACGSTPASPSPSASSSGGASALPLPAPSRPPAAALDWGRGVDVARPDEAFAAPSPAASIAFSLGGNRSGHPLHFPGQAMMADLAVLPTGGPVAGGYVYPGWHPTAWTSADVHSWTLQPIADTEFTFPVAMAGGRDGGTVAVGRSAAAPA